MTLIKGIFPVQLILLVLSAIWSICVCKPIKKAELLQQEGDLFAPNFTQNTIWPKTHDPPSVWPAFHPTVWTYQPNGTNDTHDSESELPVGLRIFIFILVMLGVVAAVLCNHYFCEDENRCLTKSAVNAQSPIERSPQANNLSRSSIRESANSIHSPPTNNSPTNLNRMSQELQNRGIPENAESSTSLNRNTQELQNIVVPIDTGASNTYVTDKPPTYSNVVTSDLLGGTLKFPDVPVMAPRETPPPKYDKLDLQ